MRRRLLPSLLLLPLLVLVLAWGAARGQQQQQQRQHHHGHHHHHHDDDNSEAGGGLYAFGPHRRHPRGYYEQKFLAWLDRFHVTLQGGRQEYARRLDIFAANDDFIVERNAANRSYTLGHNAFSHLTLDEFHARFKLGTCVV